MIAVAEIFSIAIFFVAIVLTAIVFVVWVAVTALRAIINGLTALFYGPRRTTVSHNNMIFCPTRGCGASNPAHARFCRRCGHGLPMAQRVQVRRAAVW
jgi:hypothetical protein